MSRHLQKYKVVVVGGGVAGLGTAQKLFEKGIKDFIILEAQNSVGGRVATVPYGNHFIEYGAQWIHGEEGNVVYQIANENGLTDVDATLTQTGTGSTNFVREDGTIIDEDSVMRFQILMANITEDAEERILPSYRGSIGSYYQEKFSEVNQWGQMGLEMFDWYGRFQCCIEGTNTWFECSGIGNSSYKECPGNQVMNWSNGFKDLLNILQKNIPDKNICLNCPVKRVRWKIPHKTCAEVELSSGEKIEAEHVVMTPSLGVLKATHKELFEPLLPDEKVKAIKGLGIDAVDKIYFEFANQWWEDGCDGFSFLRKEPCYNFNDENWERGLLGFYEVYKQPNMLCGWITGEAAKAMEQASLETVKQRCLKIMRSYLSPKYNVSEVIWCDRTKWYTNAFIRGSYSFHSLFAADLDVWPKDLASPICNDSGCPILCFAGEATHDCYFSTVHGALESGWREANRIIEYQSCSSSADSQPTKTSVTPYREYFDVVVIGAGAAGLGAVRHLEAKGVSSVLILEAADHIGGRVETMYLPHGTFLDIGAQWIHGEEGNVLFEIAAPRGLIADHISVDGEGDFYTEEGVQISPEVINSVKEFLSQVKDECRNHLYLDFGNHPSSVGHYSWARFNEYLSDCVQDDPQMKHLKSCIYHWDVRWERVDNACDSLCQLSSKRWGEYSYCSGVDNMNPKYGMISLLKAVANDIKAEIRLNAEVVRIDYCTDLRRKINNFERADGRRPVIVTCRDGSSVHCQHVIMTASLGYLKENSNVFVPPLPSYISAAISHIGFGVIDKIFLEYDEPWWPKDFIGAHFVWTKDIPNFDRITADTVLLSGHRLEMKDFWYRAITGFDLVSGHKAALCGWIGGPEAQYMETLPSEEIGRTCTWLLRKFTRMHNIPEPKNVFRSQWATNPLTLGSYSHRVAGDKIEEDTNYVTKLNYPVFAQCSNFEVPLVVLAGEANSLNHYSTVHGALANGMQQANHYIKFREKFLKNELTSKL